MVNIPCNSFLLAGLCASSLGIYAQNERPNIIFIMSDDHSAEAISCYNGSFNNTPNIDALAQKGTRFTNCFCTNGISGPSRATILTGTYNHINGHLNNYVAFDTLQPVVSTVFQDHGYQTAMIGKWHLQSDPQGFDYWNILPGQGHYYNPEFIKQGERYQAEGYVTELITDEAIKWIEQRDKEAPFFMMVHHKAPHRNWLPDLKYIDKFRDTDFEIPANFHQSYSDNEVYHSQMMSIAEDMIDGYDLKITHPDSLHLLIEQYTGISRMDEKTKAEFMAHYRQRYLEYETVKEDSVLLAERKLYWYLQDYLACIESVDQSVGEIVEYLKKAGLDENTIIVYTSDQGFFLGEHGWFDKRFMYEESLRMPLIIADPRLKQTEEVRDQMVMNVDFAPTFLTLADIPVPEYMQGQSFEKQLCSNNEKGRESVYYHYFEYPGPHSVPRHYGVRTERYKLIHFYFDVDQWELYDLQKDPHEMHSVYNTPQYSDVQAELFDLLNENRTKYNDTISSVPTKSVAVANAAKVKSQQFAFQPAVKYSGRGEATLYDGMIENQSPLAIMDYDNWLGFEGDNLDLNWELAQRQYINAIKIRVLNAPGSWIFPPESISLSVNEGATMKFSLSEIDVTKTKRTAGGTILEYTIPIGENVDEIQFFIKNIGTCPDGHAGAGEKAWLFVEEIIIQ